jgi:hypothetical protein
MGVLFLRVRERQALEALPWMRRITSLMYRAIKARELRAMRKARDAAYNASVEWYERYVSGDQE